MDAARFVAAVCVVFIHGVESHELAPFKLIGTFSVPFYLFAALYFQARSLRRSPELDFCTYAWRRVRRLYVPFLAWSAVYVVAINLKHVLLVHSGWSAPAFWELWAGPAEHLYFLPQLLIVTLLSAALHRAFGARRAARWAVITLALAAGAVMAVVPRPDWLNYVRGEGYFFDQAWRSLPSALLGLGLAWALGSLRDAVVLNGLIGFGGAALTAAMVVTQIRYGYSRLERTLSGMGWMLAALAVWRGPWVTWLAKAGRRSYGVYLSHVLVIQGVQAVAHWAGAPTSVGLDVVVIACGVVGAYAIATGLGRWRGTAWMV
jgi:fucose 4-O-acetylase-like acetyltransferase